MNVSVIIPAHNVAETISDTLESLRGQTFRKWEALVVDDGSSDDTLVIATSFADRDARIRTVSQPQMGVSAARNKGISLARFDWLLFLDADDWLLPLHLERLTKTLVLDPNLDAVHCGWVRVTPDGMFVGEKHWPQSGDLFPVLARLSAFSIHACVVRRLLVEAVGCFDTSLRTCEDWDLWQRIARAGARFGAIPEVLACYRMRPDSASINGFQMLADALHVITQGHSPDARVSNPQSAYANGMPAEQLPSAKLFWACWPAGLVIGCGQDVRPLLSMLQGDRSSELNPDHVAQCLFEAAILPSCQPLTAWDKLWPKLEQRIDEFLLGLEEQSMTPELALRVSTRLERLIVAHSTTPRPLIVGTIYAVCLEVIEPIPDIVTPPSAVRLHCVVEFEGERLGIIELPILEGLVSSYVLADAIAAEFAWSILGHFFHSTVYRELTVKRSSTGSSLWRGSLCLANELPEDEQALWSVVHDCIGWTVFLQELWGRPHWPKTHFYNPQAWKVLLQELRAGFQNLLSGKVVMPTAWTSSSLRHRVEDGWLMLEVGEELRDVWVSGQKLLIIPMIGGVSHGAVPIEVKGNIVRSQELRAAITKESGIELAVTAVREALLGKPIAGPNLRDRLVASATAQHRFDGKAPATAANIVFAPGSNRALGRAMSSGVHSVVLARHFHGAIGTSVSRRAMLPVAATRDLIDAALAKGEPVIQVPGASEQPERVVYAPDLIWHPPEQTPEFFAKRTFQVQQTEVYGRNYFETLFATQPDPWKYTNPYEQTKYEQTLGLLPSTQIGQALELACAEGHFTAQLSPRVGSLIAADISQVALERSAKRCAGLKNIRFVHLDLIKEPLPGRFELIVCSEVLYYLNGRDALQAFAQKVVEALEPGGYFLTAHANLVVDEPEQTGFDWDHPFGAKVIGETFASTDSLQLLKELRTPLYRIQLFQRDFLQRPLSRSTPEITELPQSTPLPPEIAGYVLWNGGSPRRYGTTQVVTERLPILMYHRVHPEGSPARYQVTPEAFEDQLRYLHDAGFYSVKLEDWRTAIATKSPLPGRAVLITFDDGYLDFLIYAWPLLKHYGFSATVFLVTDQIGQTNHWDSFYSEEIPLLRWKQIRQLQDEGVEFASHSASHRPLTALSHEEVVREGACSRAIIERELGVPIKAFAYPYGDADRVVQHLIGACGYVFGLSCRPGLSSFQDSLLALPRIEVTGSDGLNEFVTKLSP